jgi:iron complex outermembrane recepter protein
MKGSLLAAGAVICALQAGTASAQTAPGVQSNDAAASTAPGADVGEIVVTAQKRAESIQKVPISVAAVTGRTLEEKNIGSPQALGAIVSGLHFVPSGAGNTPYIRSFGTNTALAGNEPPVTLYVDGVYIPSPTEALFSLSAIDRVEVLKGPQGTLFGRNAAAGAVQIITKTPSHTTSVDMKVGYANYQTVSGSFYGTTGLTDTLAANLSVAGFKQSKGWGRNLFDGSETYLSNNWNVRSKAVWTPTADTTITVSGDYDRTRADPGTVIAAIPGTLPNKSVASGKFFDTNSDVPQFRVARQGGGYLRIEHEMPWGNLTSITSGRHLHLNAEANSDLTPSPASAFIYDIKETTYTQELNLQSKPSSDLKWIVGFFYYDDKSAYAPFEQRGTSSGQGANGGLVYANTQATKSYAGYVQATAPLWTDQAHLTLGARYTNDNRDVPDGNNYTRTASGALVLTTAFHVPSITQNAFTYRASVDYSFSPSAMVYASYNRGFKSGNYNLTNPLETPLKPEFVDSVEAGMKSKLFDNRVRFNVAGFYYRISDLQVRTLDPATARAINSNAAKSRYLGIEGELDIALADQLDLNANATYVDTKYISYANAQFYTFGPGGTPLTSFLGDASGNKLINTEPFSANAGLRYHVETSIGQIVANTDISYHSHLYFDPQNAVSRPSYTLLGASVGWTSATGTWGIDLWGQNLLNEKYSAQLAYTLTGGLRTQGAPITYGVSGRYHF